MKSYIYPTATSTSRALIRYIIDMMNREPDRIFYFAFSGGTTPSLMFDIWAHEYREETPWMRMRIFWVDERCVPVNDSDSNYGTMFRLLLSYLRHVPSSVARGETLFGFGMQHSALAPGISRFRHGVAGSR